MARRRKKSSRRRGGTMQSVRRGGHKVARSSWRASGYRRNPRRRHRRGFRRNPGFSVAGITSRLKQGVTDATMVLGGKVVTRFLANFAPDTLKDSVPKVAAVQILAALASGIAASRFLGADKARFILAGGIAGAGEALLKGLDATKDNVGKLLGDDFLELGSYPSEMGAYLPGMGDDSMGDDDVDAALGSRGIGLYDAATGT